MALLTFRIEVLIKKVNYSRKELNEDMLTYLSGPSVEEIPAIVLT